MTDYSAPPSPSGADRRQHPRESVRLPAKIVTRVGEALDATIVDRSLRGMRIRLGKDAFVPKEISILELNAGVAHEAVVVWKVQDDLGVALKASHSVRMGVGPQAEKLRKLWSEAVSR